MVFILRYFHIIIVKNIKIIMFIIITVEVLLFSPLGVFSEALVLLLNEDGCFMFVVAVGVLVWL